MIMTLPLLFILVFAAAFIAVLLGVLWMALRRRRRRGELFGTGEIAVIRARFDELEKRVHWDPRYCILQGDMLLETLLRAMGYRGALGEMLKRAGRKFDNGEALWRAHKLRNRIAHELEVPVSVADARKALRAYISAYREAGVSV